MYLGLVLDVFSEFVMGVFGGMSRVYLGVSLGCIAE